MAFNNKRLFFIEVSFSGKENLLTDKCDMGMYSLLAPYKIKKSQLLQKKEQMVEFLKNYSSGNVFRSQMILKYRIGMIKHGFLRVYAQNGECERLGSVLYEERIVDERSVVRFRSYGDVYADVKECFAKARGRKRRQLTDSIDLGLVKYTNVSQTMSKEEEDNEVANEVAEPKEEKLPYEEEFPSLS